MSMNMYIVSGDCPSNEELALRIQAGDTMAAEQLVMRNEGYLTKLAQELNLRCEIEDLKQEGAIALLEAARKFDPVRGVKLLTYATPAIRAAMLDCGARSAYPLSIPSSRYEQLRQAAYILAAASPEAKETALLEQVQSKLSVSEKVARSLITEPHTLLAAVQLGDDVFRLSYGGDPAKRHEALLRQDHVGELLSILDVRAQTVLVKYFGLDDPDGVGMTFEEIAVRLNFNSPSAAEKAFRKAIATLRDCYGKIGCYGSWRRASSAVGKALCDSAAPEEYSAPQRVWYENLDVQIHD